MLSLGLSAADAATYATTLGATHSIHVGLQVMDLDGNRLLDASRLLIDGQVNVDADADVSRSCSLSLHDPLRRLHFDSDSAADTGLFLDTMIRVVYSVKVPALGRWVSCPIFTGPITKMERTDDVVNLELQGKEVLAMGAAWVPRTYKQNSNRAATIKAIMQECTGETKFSFPESTLRLGKDLSLGRESVPWDIVKKLAKSMNMQLFYDGRGVLRLRPKPDHITFHVKHGDGGMLLTEPQITYSDDDLKNIVWVKGAKAKNQNAVSYWLAAPRSHPLSPWSLGRNGVPRYLLEVVSNDHVRTQSEAQALAQTKLRQLLFEQVEGTFDMMVAPHWDPLDVIKVTSPEVAMSFRVRTFSIPLSVGENMTVGYLRRVSRYAKDTGVGGGSGGDGGGSTHRKHHHKRHHKGHHHKHHHRHHHHKQHHHKAQHHHRRRHHR